MTDDETFRRFFMRRPWLHGEHGPLSHAEYDAIVERRVVMTLERRGYLDAFMYGYLCARRPKARWLREGQP